MGFFFLLFHSQKLNNQIVRLPIFVVPAAGMVRPTCRQAGCSGVSRATPA